MEVAQPARDGGPPSRRPGPSATLGAEAQDIDKAQKGPRELGVFERRHTGILPLSRPSGALARRDRNGQTLGDLGDATLVRSSGGSVFVAYGTLNLAGFGRVFYVILSDAPLDQEPEWVLILIRTRRADRSDLLEAAGCAHVGSLNARAAPRLIGDAPLCSSSRPST